MKNRWFVQWGWIHRPVSWQGIILVLLAAIFCVQVFIAIDSHSHSVSSNTFYGIFPYFVPALIALEWIAAKTSD